MTDFAIGRYGANDYRLIWWDGSSETELGTWDHKPDEAEKIAAAIGYFDLSLDLDQGITIICSIAASHQGTTNKEEGHPFPWE